MKEFDIREHEVFAIQRDSILLAARLFKVSFAELKGNFELLNIIKERDSELYQSLTDFSASYLNYYYFAKGISSSKKYELNQRESELLHNQRTKVEESRNKFIELLNVMDKNQ